MTQERVLKEASFAKEAVTYHTLGVGLTFALTIVGIPLLLIALPIATWYWNKQYSRLRVVLTSRDLKVSRGVLMREEKSIPLEKITDLAVFQGPVMRHFGLKGIQVETAGQTSAGGALVKVIGIDDTDGFRDLVLRQRDRIADREGDVESLAATGRSSSAASPTLAEPVLETLRSIDQTLRRIERSLAAGDRTDRLATPNSGVVDHGVEGGTREL
jgi:putative membrane protein